MIGLVDCIFCEIVAGTASAHVVWEDPTTMAFLSIDPAAVGHTLVVPKRHASDLWDIDAAGIADVAQAVHAVAGVIRDRLDPEGLTLFQANRPAGWQDVFHLHVHVVPRATGDGLAPPWRSVPERQDRLEHIHALLTRGAATG